MEAQPEEDSLLSPITAAADRSESTTLLVAKDPVCLECFNRPLMTAPALHPWHSWLKYCTRSRATRPPSPTYPIPLAKLLCPARSGWPAEDSLLRLSPFHQQSGECIYLAKNAEYAPVSILYTWNRHHISLFCILCIFVPYFFAYSAYSSAYSVYGKRVCAYFAYYLQIILHITVHILHINLHILHIICCIIFPAWTASGLLSTMDMSLSQQTKVFKHAPACAPPWTIAHGIQINW